MDFRNEIRSYISFLKKYFPIILAIYLIFEIIIFIFIGRTSVFSFIASIFITLYVLCTICLMFKDMNTSFLIYIVSIPILPIILYMFYRLNMTWAGESIYFIYSLILIYNVIKNRHDFENIIFNGKYRLTIILYTYFIISAFISIGYSIYKLEAVYLVFLGIVNMVVFSTFLLSYKQSKLTFYKKVILYLSIGATISTIPDSVISLYSIIFQGDNIHLYGVLGSNFMLGYDIIVLPLILINAFSNEISKEYNIIYKVLLIIQVIGLCTQRSRGIFVVLLFSFVCIIIIDRKHFIKYGIIALVVLLCVGNNIMMRGELSDVKETIQNEGIVSILNNGKKAGILSKLSDQTRNRRPIWTIALRMLDDNKYFGVGPGQFKYNYTKYGGNQNNIYSDSHNIYLNVATEYGIIFALVFFAAWLFSLLASIIFSLKNKRIFLKEYTIPIFIGMASMIIFGNITGQAFMTSVYPISIAPLFIFTTTMTILLMIRKNGNISD